MVGMVRPQVVSWQPAGNLVCEGYPRRNPDSANTTVNDIIPLSRGKDEFTKLTEKPPMHHALFTITPGFSVFTPDGRVVD